MVDGGLWFYGEKFSLVDIVLVLWVVRLWLIDYYKEGGMGILESGEDEVWG